jgi:hypothetical protein
MILIKKKLIGGSQRIRWWTGSGRSSWIMVKRRSVVTLLGYAYRCLVYLRFLCATPSELPIPTEP